MWMSSTCTFEGRSLALASHDDISPLTPSWPVSHYIQVVRNDPHVLALNLRDKNAVTVQLSLYEIPPDLIDGGVLLGGTPKVVGLSTDYGATPADVAGEWIRYQVAPWLQGLGYNKFIVRAHFKGAPEYFQHYGFASDPEIGEPFRTFDLSGDDALPTSVRSEAFEVMNLDISGYVDMDSHREAQDRVIRDYMSYLATVKDAPGDKKRSAHDATYSEAGRQRSQEEFSHRFGMFNLATEAFERLNRPLDK